PTHRLAEPEHPQRRHRRLADPQGVDRPRLDARDASQPPRHDTQGHHARRVPPALRVGPRRHDHHDRGLTMTDARTTRTRQRAREDSTEARKERFLKELARRANVSAAAKKAKIPRSTVYDWYKADEEFARRWDEAVDVAVDGLEEEAWRRAKDGVLKPVYQKGEKVGQVREYSDQLMVTLLKA